MKIFYAVLLLGLCLTAQADNPEQPITLQGVIREQRTDVKSLAAWNAPSDPYYILEMTGGNTQTPHNNLALHPSAAIATKDLQKFTGQYVTLKGYHTEGKRPDTPLEQVVEQVPIEPKFKTTPEGKIAATGWQTMKRGRGFVVLAVAKTQPSVTTTLPGTVLDYEWAHESNRLALLIVDKQQQGRLIIADAERTTPVIQIPIPLPYRPSCFAWLADDSGFLLAMAKPEKDDDPVEDNFYRYTFAGKRFEQVYQTIERQYADIFSIETDHGTAFWAAASAGEGHPDLAIYQDAATVLLTDVYPGSIAPIFWQDHSLWTVTEAYLEFGYTRAERARHQGFNPQQYPERSWGDVVAYRINPLTKQAVPEQTQLAVLEAALQTSYDHRYRSDLVRNEGLFTVTLSPTANR
ncbi:MAG: hypothetical protein PHR16_01625 [Methylovulum sp.]|nr:hypothetical protein [Methylovulum sp.]